jgi:hypothetical protein
MSVQELETAVSRLSKEELATFSQWFEGFVADAWDRQIEKDAQDGRLDAFYQSLQHENEGQPDIPLNDVLDKEELS